MNDLDLSVIILSFNTKDITHKCLIRVEEAKKYCEKKFGNKVEIIVLDNASSDDSVVMIKREHPEVKLIALTENTGFSKGNNIAMKASKSPFILLLNSDAYVEEESLYKLLAYFRVNLNCDVIGAKLKYGSGKLQPSAGSLPHPVNLIFWILGLSLFPFLGKLVSPFHPKDRGFFAKAHRVGWIMGAFFALKRKVFETTGGFDENLFMHMEEVEWCKRINDKRLKVWYVPQVEAIHLHAASTNFDLGAGFINELSGIKYYLQKHYPLFYWPTKLFLVLGLILRIIAFSLLGKTKRARIYVEGMKVI